MRIQIAKFLHYLEFEKHLSALTVKTYAQDLTKLYELAQRHNLNTSNQITTKHIRMFIMELHAQDLQSKTISKFLAATRSFYRYLNKYKLCAVNPAINLRAPKGEKRLPKNLDVDRAMHLLDTERPDTFTNARDLALLELFYSSGLRLAELATLDLVNLDLAGGVVKVLGKGNKERIVPVGSKAIMALKKWFKWRALFAKENAVFISKKGTRLAMRSIQVRVTLAGAKFLGENLHPHMLRHSFASHMLQSSQDLRAVQELLGHASVATTQIYTHLDFQHLATIYDKAHPRARRKD